MQKMGEALKQVAGRIPTPAFVRPAAEPVIEHRDRAGAPIFLSKSELGSLGGRVVVNSNGDRRLQFGLCQASDGEWVYPELSPPQGEDSAELVTARTARDRARMKRCKTQAAPRTGLLDD